MLLFALVTAAAAAAVTVGPDITNHLNNIGCKLMTVADDTLYGRMSVASSSKFFVGIVPLKS